MHRLLAIVIVCGMQSLMRHQSPAVWVKGLFMKRDRLLLTTAVAMCAMSLAGSNVETLRIEPLKMDIWKPPEQSWHFKGTRRSGKRKRDPNRWK